MSVLKDGEEADVEGKWMKGRWVVWRVGETEPSGGG
jgi:hypothetical protein